MRPHDGMVSSEAHYERVRGLIDYASDQVLKRRALAAALRELKPMVGPEAQARIDRVIAENNCGPAFSWPAPETPKA